MDGPVNHNLIHNGQSPRDAGDREPNVSAEDAQITAHEGWLADRPKRITWPQTEQRQPINSVHRRR